MKKKWKYFLIGACIIGLLAGYRFYVIQEEDNSRYELDDGIVIESVESYSGAFVEDGEDKEVEDVWAIVVKNNSKKDVQYLNINVNKDQGVAHFEITCLVAGSEAIVLERDGQAYDNSKHAKTYQIENIAFYQQERSIYPDIFELSVNNNVLRIKNKSQQDITNTIYVYYKNKDDDRFLGGITYRISFGGGLKAGETKQVQSKHYDPSISEIMYITYQ